MTGQRPGIHGGDERFGGVAPGTTHTWVTGRSAGILVGAGISVLIVALASAVVATLPMAAGLARAGGWSNLLGGVLVGVTLMVVAAAATTAVALAGRRHPVRAFMGALALFVAVRAGAAVCLDGALASDWLAYHRLAKGWMQGAPLMANRPMGYPAVLGEAYRMLGAHPWVGEIVNVAVATAGVLLVAMLVWRAAGARAASVAVMALAVAPGPALYTVILGTETLYATALLVVALVATAMLRAISAGRADRSTMVLACVTGSALGLSAYVRPTSLILIPTLALLPIVLRGRRAVRFSLALLMTTALILAPATISNGLTLGRWTPSTSLFTGWQLYVGLNAETGGRWSAMDVRRLDAQAPGDDGRRLAAELAAGSFDVASLRAAADRDDVAFRLAIERLRHGWLPVLAILPGKAVSAWGPADSAIDWVLPAPASTDLSRAAMTVAAQLWWLAVLAGSVIAMVARRGSSEVALVVSAIIVPIALSLLVLEVQPRYHEPVLPLIVALAAIGWARGGTPVRAHLH